MFGVDNILRSVLPVVVTESNPSRVVSFCGTGFLVILSSIVKD